MPESVDISSGGSLRDSLTSCSNNVVSERPIDADLALAARVRRLELAKVRDHQAVALAERDDLGAVRAFDEHLDRAVRQLQKLQHARDRADRVEIAGARFVDVGAALGDQQDLLVAFHRDVERAHGFLAADEQRDDHVRKHDDVAQRQDRQLDQVGFGGFHRFDGLFSHLAESEPRIGAYASDVGRGWTPAAISSSKGLSRECKTVHAARRRGARRNVNLRLFSPDGGGRYDLCKASGGMPGRSLVTRMPPASACCRGRSDTAQPAR